MTKTDKTFTHNFEVTAETGYTTFATAEMTNWNLPEGGLRYVPVAEGDAADVNVVSGAVYEMQVGNNGSWAVPTGKWTVKTDFSTLTPKVTFIKNEEGEQPLDVTYDFEDITAIMAMNPTIPASEQWTADGTNAYYEVAQLPLLAKGITLTSATDVSSKPRLLRSGEANYAIVYPANSSFTVTAPEGYCIKSIDLGNKTKNKIYTLWLSHDGMVANPGNNPAADGYYWATYRPNGWEQPTSVKVERQKTGDSEIQKIIVHLAEIVEYPDLYLRGADNGWVADETSKMTNNNGVYTITMPKLYGAFKISDAAWSDELTATTQDLAMVCDKNLPIDHYPNGGENMGTAQPLDYAIVTYNSHNMKIKISGTPAEVATTYLINGQFEVYTEPIEEAAPMAEPAWNNIEMTASGTNYTATVKPLAATGKFVVKGQRGGVDYNILRGGNLTVDAPAQMALTGEDATYTLDPEHKYNLTLDPETRTMSAEDAGTTGIEGITVDNNNGVTYFNLQGVPVANPQAGVYIVVRNGKASKEYIRQ